MALSPIKPKNVQPQVTGDFQTDARNFAADNKLTEKERGVLLDSFKKMDREDRIKSLYFLQGESGVLANFAQSNASLRAASNQRVGGDRTLADFNTRVETAKDKGISASETEKLKTEYRALSKDDQRQAVADLRAGGQTKLADSLEASIEPVKLTKQQEAAVGTKDLAAFQAAFDTFQNGGGKVKDRFPLTDIFRKLSEPDKQAAITQVKNTNPRLAQQLDRLLNPERMERDKFGNILPTGN